MSHAFEVYKEQIERYEEKVRAYQRQVDKFAIQTDPSFRPESQIEYSGRVRTDLIEAIANRHKRLSDHKDS